MGVRRSHLRSQVRHDFAHNLVAKFAAKFRNSPGSNLRGGVSTRMKYEMMSITSCCSNSSLEMRTTIWLISSGRISLTVGVTIRIGTKSIEGLLTSARSIVNKNLPDLNG